MMAKRLLEQGVGPHEIRAAQDEPEGTIEGYFVLWNQTDGFNSQFRRGAFRKTIAEQRGKIRLLWNHTQNPIGKILELREDDRGVWFRGKLSMGVQLAREAYELIKDGAIDSMSFGFRTIKDKYEQGVRVITEAMLMEVSPVVFAANEETSMQVRSTNFTETVETNEIHRRGYALIRAFEETLADIMWRGESKAVDLVQAATAEFKDAIDAWIQEYFDMGSDEARSSLARNDLEQRMRDYLAETEQTPEGLAQTSPLSIEEVRSLLRGRATADRDRLKAAVPEGVYTAFMAERGRAVSQLCEELRAGGFSEAERQRISGLVTRQEPANLQPLIESMSRFEQSLSIKEQ